MEGKHCKFYSKKTSLLDNVLTYWNASKSTNKMIQDE